MMPFIPGNAEHEKFRARVEQEFEISKVVPQDPHDAAYTFFRLVGIDPTPDAVAQLADGFLPSLRIMCERGYDPEGASWKEGGWRGLVWEILKRARRLRWYSWEHNNFHADTARDIINFAGFYLRMECKGEPWGEDGEPNREDL